MVIEDKQLAGKGRQIGTLRGQAVMENHTKGGWNMVYGPGGKPLRAGPHRALARVIAKKLHPEIVYSDLAKGDWVDPASIEWLVPKYEAITLQMVALYDEAHQG